MRWIVMAAVAVAVAGCREQAERRSTTPTPSVSHPGPWNLPRRPPHLVAHYMPWFEITRSADDPTMTWDHWKWSGGEANHDPQRRLPDGRRDIAAAHYPLIGPYNSWSPAVVRYHLRTAHAAGIDAFIVIWYGPGSASDQRINLLLDEAQQCGMRLAICYEEKINFPPYRDPESRTDLIDAAVADLSYVLDRYGSHPAYLKRDGKPFICQFNSWGTDTLGPKYLVPAEWKQVLAKLPGAMIYGRQNLDDSYHPPIESAYVWWVNPMSGLEDFATRAAAMRDAGRLVFFASMICPGFDDSGVWGWGSGPRKVDREGLNVLKQTMSHALLAGPDLVQIVTWNDFNEGTEVEPTREHGFTYLNAIETWWGETTGRSVNLDDNRTAYHEFVQTCSDAERAEMP